MLVRACRGRGPAEVAEVSAERRKRPQHGTPKWTEDQAARKIQSAWRGCQDRMYVDKRRARFKPWGFYTHSLALTYQSAAAGFDDGVTTRRQIWRLFEEPGSSRLAKAMTAGIVLTIVVSVAGFILETVPDIYAASPEGWNALEVVCTILFTLEYITRFSVCDEAGLSRMRFFVSPLNLCDLASVLPFYVELVLEQMGFHKNLAVRSLRLVRLIRVFRLFKLGRYASGMRLMGEAFKNSAQAISVLIFLLCMGVVLFSSTLYHLEKLSCAERSSMSSSQVTTYLNECADVFNRGVSPSFGLCCTEYDAPNDFPSIVATSWWSMVTMTSVGYGEVVPRTTQGKCVGVVAVLVGMVMIALPVAIVGQKFQDVYESHDMDEAKHRAAARMQVAGEVWTLVPASDVLTRLKQLKLKDPTYAASVKGLVESLESCWEQREQLSRERKLEHDAQDEISARVDRLLRGMREAVAADCF